MKTVNIIVPHYDIPESLKYFLSSPEKEFGFNPDWYPVHANRALIAALGYKLKITTPAYFDNTFFKRDFSGITIVDHRIKRYLNVFRNDAAGPVGFLRALRSRTEKLIYFDTKDGTHISSAVLPEVDLYLKKQLLRDTSKYSVPLVKGSLYADYYSKNPVEGASAGNGTANGDSIKEVFDYGRYKEKIGVAYNVVLGMRSLTSISTFLRFLARRVEPAFTDPRAARRILLSANFNTPAGIVGLQRRELKSFLRAWNRAGDVSLDRVPQWSYNKVLAQSEAVLSPFGYGEVCYRDYEAFIAGSALIKPDMSHLRTWPDVYRPNETYLPISWNRDDWAEELDTVLSDKPRLLRIAEQGQAVFRELWSPKGRAEFAERFVKSIEGNFT